MVQTFEKVGLRKVDDGGGEHYGGYLLVTYLFRERERGRRLEHVVKVQKPMWTHRTMGSSLRVCASGFRSPAVIHLRTTSCHYAQLLRMRKGKGVSGDSMI